MQTKHSCLVVDSAGRAESAKYFLFISHKLCLQLLHITIDNNKITYRRAYSLGQKYNQSSVTVLGKGHRNEKWKYETWRPSQTYSVICSIPACVFMYWNITAAHFSPAVGSSCISLTLILLLLFLSPSTLYFSSLFHPIRPDETYPSPHTGHLAPQNKQETDKVKCTHTHTHTMHKWCCIFILELVLLSF